ncbi:MAG: hypothetical protein ACI37S_08690 [Candidatus Gastranaerophilaceae bacterium]
MEIKAILNKPYTEKQRLDFIVENNHKNGYEIEETEKSLNAFGYTQEELVERERQIEKAEIKKQLEDLDKKRIRAVCEPSMKEENQSWLEYYNQEIQTLRAKLEV